MNKRKIWKLTAWTAVFLSILTFTPVIIPYHTFKPELMGIPYTLWTGILLMIAFIIVTWIGVIVHPGDKNER